MRIRNIDGIVKIRLFHRMLRAYWQIKHDIFHIVDVDDVKRVGFKDVKKNPATADICRVPGFFIRPHIS